MLSLAAAVLGLAALGGMGLVALSQTTRPTRWSPWPAIGHGAVGIAGFAILLAGLSGPPRGMAMGAGAFGKIAAILIALALLLAGLAVWSRRRGSSTVALLIGLHATLAVAGLILLLAYRSYPA